MNNNTWNVAFWKWMSAFVSGTLTSLILPFLTTSNYSVVIGENSYTIEQVPDSPLITSVKICIILLVFGLTWIILNYLPRLLRKQFCYWKKRIYTEQEVRQLVKDNTEMIIRLHQQATLGIQPKIFWSLKINELGLIIMSLYRCLIADNMLPKSRIKDYFREDYQSIDGSQISKYELAALLELLRSSLRDATDAAGKEENSQISKDCNELGKKLSQLENLIK